MRIAALHSWNLNGTDYISYPISHVTKHGIARKKILIKTVDRHEGRRLQHLPVVRDRARRKRKKKEKYTVGIS